MGYVITRDLIENGTKNGWQTKNYKGGKHEFRLKGGDGEICYYGYADSCDDNNAFAPLDWAIEYWGCTTIEYKNEQGEWEIL